MDECYFVDEETGEVYPTYLAVPCNHCVLCKKSKVDSFVDRCRLECQVHDSKPWFITLTYDNEHLPDAGVSVRDVQLFLKRFRINMERHGYVERVRYVAVGEYGKNTHRAHYHLLVWNLSSYTSNQYRELSYLLQKSWNKGFLMHRLVDLKDDNCFYYTAKYLKKDCDVPKGMNPTFMTSSVRDGGIGSKFLDKIAPVVRRTLDTGFQYRDKWTGKVRKLKYSRYVLGRLFPTFSRLVPVDFRRSLRDFGVMSWYCRQRWPDEPRARGFWREYVKVIRPQYCNDFYMPSPLNYDDVPDDMRYHHHDALSICSGLLSTIREGMSRFFSFKPLLQFDERRSVFLAKLFEYSHEIDLNVRAFNARRSFALAAAREIF